MAVKEVKIEKKKTKKLSRENLILIIILAVVVVYGLITLINLQVQINQKGKELDSLNDKIVIQEVKNKDLENVYNSDDEKNAEYIEDLARKDLDYAYKGERIFINIAGE